MKVGVLTVPFSGQPLPEALSYLRSLGVEALEIGCGGYPGKGHCNPRELLENKADQRARLPRQYGQSR